MTESSLTHIQPPPLPTAISASTPKRSRATIIALCIALYVAGIGVAVQQAWTYHETIHAHAGKAFANLATPLVTASTVLKKTLKGINE